MAHSCINTHSTGSFTASKVPSLEGEASIAIEVSERYKSDPVLSIRQGAENSSIVGTDLTHGGPSGSSISRKLPLTIFFIGKDYSYPKDSICDIDITHTFKQVTYIVAIGIDIILQYLSEVECHVR